MWKQSMAGIALAAATFAPAVRAQTLWEFSYTGFETGGVFDPRRELSGFFVGEDRDGDGLLRQDELSRFYLDFLEYDPRERSYCGGAGYYCEVSDFSYSLDGDLSFSADWRYSDEGATSVFYVTTGDRMEMGGYVGSGGSTWTVSRWTGQTRFAISPPPVPEPGRWAMLGAGLLGALGWRAMRRRSDRIRPRLPA